MRRLGFILGLFLCGSVLGEVVPLWEDIPGRVTSKAEYIKNDHVYEVSVPTLEFMPATTDAQKVRPTVLVLPGGGYHCQAYIKEGTAVAEWLNAQGFHAAIVKYRIPGDRAGALLDVQQAVKVLQAKADAWGVDTTKIGMIGFSAGAHLTARTLSFKDHGLAFALLIYPAYLSRDGVTLAQEVIPAQPIVPTFIMQCTNDRAFVMSSLAYAGWLCKGNHAVAYHLYPTGGHGFGLHHAWTTVAKEWLEERK